jgi:hypothetical protein
MDLHGPTTSVGTRTDYSVGPWDYSVCATRHLMAWGASALFIWLISHQPAVLLSQNKPATNNQPIVVFSQNKPASAISHQPNEQAEGLRWSTRIGSYTCPVLCRELLDVPDLYSLLKPTCNPASRTI